MKISQMIQRLEELKSEHGDVEVMFRSDAGPFLSSRVEHCVADKDEYPEDWNMPEGYEFVQIDT